jgi:hypothetical protein
MNVLQRIFTDHADAYLESRQGLVAPGQRKVIDAIRQCRTVPFGSALKIQD